MSIKKIKEADIPYEKLEKVGLTQQMIEDLPEDAQAKILSGQLSPVVPLTITTDGGEEFEGYGRFSIYEKADGELGVRIHPVMQPVGETMEVAKINPETGNLELVEIPTSERYSKNVVDQLRDGKVVLDYLYHEDGIKEPAYLQFDEETNQIIGIPSKSIDKNVQVVAMGLHLTTAEQTCMQKGSLVSFTNEDDEMLTVGLDLQSPTGVRFAVGDDKKWMENKQRDWDKYELGVNGCWMTDDNGNLQYVSEDEFDDYDVWNEVEKQRDRKQRNEPTHRGLPIK